MIRQVDDVKVHPGLCAGENLECKVVGAAMKPLRFQEFGCIIDVSFWQWVIEEKLNEWKLDCPAVDVMAGVQIGPSRPMLRLCASGHIPGKFYHVNTLDQFSNFPYTQAVAKIIPDMIDILNSQVSRPNSLLDDIVDLDDGCANVDDHRKSFSLGLNRARNPLMLKKLTAFLVVAYIDLKKYCMTYVVGCPTVGFESSLSRSHRFMISDDAVTPAESIFDREELLKVQVSCSQNPLTWLIRGEDLEIRNDPVDSSISQRTDVYVVIEDQYCRGSGTLGWACRNFLIGLMTMYGLNGLEFRFLVYRGLMNSFCTRIKFPEGTTPWHLKAGWLNSGGVTEHLSISTASFPLPHQAIFKLNLQTFLDKKIVQQDATELNVKLIKWRILPEFRPELLQMMNILIIGVGTLGCNILRDLVGWGVKKFTLIDCGLVAPSNPARQSLYLSKDVGAKKVDAAKQRLLEIRADLEIETYDIEIPMPSQQRFLISANQFLDGTSVSPDQSYTSYCHDILKKLIQSHDVMFLLTDTRESRWLPALIAQNECFRRSSENQDASIAERAEASGTKKIMCVTVALGFDSFVVIRHGSFFDIPFPSSLKLPARVEGGGFFKPADPFRARLSCYFCNDLNAPSTQLTRHRTLDQQCTVTRSGVASFAGSIASELIAALSQAPNGFSAMPHDRSCELLERFKKFDSDFSAAEKIIKDGRHKSCLGKVPHVTRGSLSNFTLTSDWHPSFENCVCCGISVQRAYTIDPKGFIENVVRESSLLESVSGLSRLKAEAQIWTSKFEYDDADQQDDILLLMPPVQH